MVGVADLLLYISIPNIYLQMYDSCSDQGHKFREFLSLYLLIYLAVFLSLFCYLVARREKGETKGGFVVSGFRLPSLSNSL